MKFLTLDTHYQDVEIGSLSADATVRLPFREPFPGFEDDELWYHDHETRAHWERLDSLRQVEEVIRTRHAGNPWADIGRFSQRNTNGEFEQLHLFEVLGWADSVYVSRVGFQWRWSSWPAHAHFHELTPGTVGPYWYRADVYEQQLVTINDAVAQLRPALHAIEEIREQSPGFLWLPRECDLTPNEHLRVPLDL